MGILRGKEVVSRGYRLDRMTDPTKILGAAINEIRGKNGKYGSKIQLKNNTASLSRALLRAIPKLRG